MRLARFLCCSLLTFTPLALFAGEYSLEVRQNDPRPYDVDVTMNVDGHLKTPQRGGQGLALKLQVAAELQYAERALPARGREALALRSIREFDKAQADITVDGQVSSSRLRPERKILVAQADVSGVRHISLDGAMTFAETELLTTPADPLALTGLIPLTPVDSGDEWEPESWVAQVLTGIDAVLSQELTCTLKKISDAEAVIAIDGSIEGAHLGTATKISIVGELVFDRQLETITSALITQKEERAIGAVSPGLDLTATVKLKRSLRSRESGLTNAVIAKTPLDPSAENYRLEFRSPWKATFLHGRDWHVFQQTSRVAVVRLMLAGNLVSQFNVSPVPAVKSGSRTPIDQFSRDISTTLADKLKSIDSTDDLTLPNGGKAWKVVTTGAAGDTAMEWRYYLCTAPTGRQIAFVFAVEKELAERLGDRPDQIVRSLTFD